MVTSSRLAAFATEPRVRRRRRLPQPLPRRALEGARARSAHPVRRRRGRTKTATEAHPRLQGAALMTSVQCRHHDAGIDDRWYRRSPYRRSASRMACTSSSVTTDLTGVYATSAPFRPTNLTSRPTGVTKSRDAFTGQLDLRTCRQDAISGEFARSERANSPLWCSSRCRTCAVQPSAPSARSAIARRASEAASSFSPPPPSPSPVLTEL